MKNSKIAALAEKTPDRFYDRLLNHLQEAVNILDTDLNVIFWNASSEQLTGYSSDEVLGKKCLKNVLIDQDDSGILPCGKRCPVVQVLKDGNVRSFDAYLQHKEGHRFPVHMRIIPIKNQEDEIIAAVETFREQSPKVSLPQSKEQLRRMGMLDPLTSMGNRRYLEMHLKSRLEELRQLGLSFGILFLEVDGMEDIKATYGSVVGDKLLKMISQTLSSSIRFFELTARWEEEKFVVVLLKAAPAGGTVKPEGGRRLHKDHGIHRCHRGEIPGHHGRPGRAGREAGRAQHMAGQEPGFPETRPRLKDPQFMRKGRL